MFFYSLSCSNGYGESGLPQLKHLLNDRKSCITRDLITVELKIRLKSTVSCIALHKYILSSEDVLRAIEPDEKYTFKRKCVQ